MPTRSGHAARRPAPRAPCRRRAGRCCVRSSSAACSNQAPTAGGRPGRPARAGRPAADGTTLVGWDATGARRDPDQAAQGRRRPGSRPVGPAVLAATLADGHDRDERPASISASRSPGDRSRPRTRPARPRPDPTTSRPGTRRAAGSRRSPATCCRATGSASCSSTRRLRPRSRSRSIDPSSPRRRSGSTTIALVVVTGDAGRADVDDRRHDDRRADRRAEPATGSSRPRPTARRIATMAGPGRPDRRSATRPAGWPATGRRSPRSRRRTAPRPRSPSPSTRPVSGSRSPGPPRTARSPSPSTTAAPTGAASRNRRSAPPAAPSSPGAAKR